MSVSQTSPYGVFMVQIDTSTWEKYSYDLKYYTLIHAYSLHGLQLYSYDLRADRLQSLVDILVTAVDLFNIADDALAFG